jgi:hypothetical protein
MNFLLREPDAGKPHVRFDERDVETERFAPPRHVSTLPRITCPRCRIEAREIRTLLAIAFGTGPREVLRVIVPSMLGGDDVVDVKRSRITRLGKCAVLASIAGAGDH